MPSSPARKEGDKRSRAYNDRQPSPSVTPHTTSHSVRPSSSAFQPDNLNTPSQSAAAARRRCRSSFTPPSPRIVRPNGSAHQARISAGPGRIVTSTPIAQVHLSPLRLPSPALGWSAHTTPRGRSPRDNLRSTGTMPPWSFGCCKDTHHPLKKREHEQTLTQMNHPLQPSSVSSISLDARTQRQGEARTGRKDHPHTRTPPEARTEVIGPHGSQTRTPEVRGDTRIETQEVYNGTPSLPRMIRPLPSVLEPYTPRAPPPTQQLPSSRQHPYPSVRESPVPATVVRTPQRSFVDYTPGGSGIMLIQSPTAQDRDEENTPLLRLDRVKLSRPEIRSPLARIPGSNVPVHSPGADGTASVQAAKCTRISVCDICYIRKTKCDKARPSCRLCIERDYPCHYSDGVELPILPPNLNAYRSGHRRKPSTGNKEPPARKSFVTIVSPTNPKERIVIPIPDYQPVPFRPGKAFTAFKPRSKELAVARDLADMASAPATGDIPEESVESVVAGNQLPDTKDQPPVSETTTRSQREPIDLAQPNVNRHDESPSLDRGHVSLPNESVDYRMDTLVTSCKRVFKFWKRDRVKGSHKSIAWYGDDEASDGEEATCVTFEGTPLKRKREEAFLSPDTTSLKIDAGRFMARLRR
ncbi:hypothetical protein BD324DRAFT_490136 [Kockovaella imperatae]|uniref:Zn(2)-C6 fungal-type domain-containing protein n=1 Tax=Kockovaella imperatae TaxID=4999 RepID=A0A1Y1UED5_9TREE|nr:hypothetical protein BD324DRAFT_490136 [Kockovaella imperatae]ORX36349.1 hypothetical protein BD324DRAFT_490136 [Kockovaella imperatae]